MRAVAPAAAAQRGRTAVNQCWPGDGDIGGQMAQPPPVEP